MLLVDVFSMLYFYHYFIVYSFYLLKKGCCKILCCVMLAGASYMSCLMHFLIASFSFVFYLSVVLYSSMLYRLIAKEQQAIAYSPGVGQAIPFMFEQFILDVHTRMKLPRDAFLRMYPIAKQLITAYYAPNQTALNLES